MVISPPFLPSPVAGESESDWFDRAMVQPRGLAENVQAPKGSFPISAGLMWHNGLHWVAPHEKGVFGLVRAVADAEVVFVHQPGERSTAADHAQHYNAGGEPRWTDNGCVVLRHTTDIGAARGVATRFTYFSLTMHLKAIEPTLKVGSKVYRKDPIGKAGTIYDDQANIHFEICCNEAELKKLIGRDPAWIELEKEPAPTADGRTDCVYGDILIYLPGTTAIDYRKPTEPLRPPLGTHRMLDKPQWVVMRYGKGQLTLRSLDLLGQPIGVPVEVEGAEYDLYKTACECHAKVYRPDGKSSPSGWYELLRFGRNLGPDPLPYDAAHWQHIHTAQGLLWADLNTAGSYKFSDADFRTVMGWKCIDDDRDLTDQRAQSNEISRLLQNPTPFHPDRDKPNHKHDRLGLPEVQAKLKHVICRFPTEWDRTTIVQRHRWLKDPKHTAKPLEGQAWDRFVAHCEAMSFTDLPQEFKDAMWRINPRTFIETMRKCSWLSKAELMQLVPEFVIRGKGAGMAGPFVYEQPGKLAGGLMATHGQHLNAAMRKFGVVGQKRLAAFIGNSIQETSWWSDLDEKGGNSLRYTPWYGRGFLQLTNPNGKFSNDSNYGKYFQFRGRSLPGASDKTLENWRDLISKDSFDASNSAGAYWSWMGANDIADKGGLNSRRIIMTAPESQQHPGQQKTIYENVIFRQVACTINLPAAAQLDDPKLNGLPERYCAYTIAQLVLWDTAEFPDENGKPAATPKDLSSRRPK